MLTNLLRLDSRPSSHDVWCPTGQSREPFVRREGPPTASLIAAHFFLLHNSQTMLSRQDPARGAHSAAPGYAISDTVPHVDPHHVTNQLLQAPGGAMSLMTTYSVKAARPACFVALLDGYDRVCERLEDAARDFAEPGSSHQSPAFSLARRHHRDGPFSWSQRMTLLLLGYS